MSSIFRNKKKIKFIENCPWFINLPKNVYQNIAESAKIKIFKKNTYLFKTGEVSTNLFCIMSGRIRLIIVSGHGQEFGLIDLESGSWVGEHTLIDDSTKQLDAKVNEESEVIILPRQLITKLANTHPLIYQNLFKEHVERTKDLYKVLTGMAFYPLSVRLAARLLTLIKEHGHAETDGIYLDTTLSQRDFAQLSLGSRQRINKIFSQWREKEIISISSNRYLIKNIEALKQEATHTNQKR